MHIMYVPGKGIVEGVEEEGVMAMSASDPAHTRHLKEGKGISNARNEAKSNEEMTPCSYLRDRDRCGR